MTDAKKAPMAGMESMLRAMGLGQVIDAANKLAQSGALEKLVAVVEVVNELNERCKRIEAALGISPNAEPGSRPAISGPDPARGLASGDAANDGGNNGPGPARAPT